MSQFRLKPFLRFIDTAIFSKYLLTHEIETNPPTDEKKCIDYFINTIGDAEEETQKRVESELAEVKELANESGITIITQLVETTAPDVLETLSRVDDGDRTHATKFTT